MRALSILPSLLLASSAEACLRLLLVWEPQDKSVSGELWDSGMRVCTISTSLVIPPGSDLWGFPFECVYGYKADIGESMEAIVYEPRRKHGYAHMDLDTSWNITKEELTNTTDSVLVWLSEFTCLTCKGPYCECGRRCLAIQANAVF